MKKSVAIIGGGSAALMLALKVDPNKYEVTIYEKNKALGRKFLVAGDGGFNLTHGSDIHSMIAQYYPSEFLKPVLQFFSNTDLRNTLGSLGIATFEGSSNRVFPKKGIKPIEVLNAFVEALKKQKVNFKLKHEWEGWGENQSLLFKNGVFVIADYTVFALGGASWKVTGSDGSWKKLFDEKLIETNPFFAANCAFGVDWDADFIKNHAGKPLKNISLKMGENASKGELVISEFGLEGNAIYALSEPIQQALNERGKAPIYINLKPMFTFEQVLEKLQQSKERNTSLVLKNDLKLSATQIQLLKTVLSKDAYLSPAQLAEAILNLPISLTQSAPIDEAISTTGGISLTAINTHFELKHRPNTYCIGEMLDWNAPTGGYLLQACFSMGAFVAGCLNDLR